MFGFELIRCAQMKTGVYLAFRVRLPSVWPFQGPGATLNPTNRKLFPWESERSLGLCLFLWFLALARSLTVPTPHLSSSPRDRQPHSPSWRPVAAQGPLPGTHQASSALTAPDSHPSSALDPAGLGAVSQAASVCSFLQGRSHVWVLVISNTGCPEPALEPRGFPGPSG